MAFVKDERLRKELIHRHIAWMTALRHQLRLSRSWEHTEMRLNKMYSPIICEDYNQKLEVELRNLIDDSEILSHTDFKYQNKLFENERRRVPLSFYEKHSDLSIIFIVNTMKKKKGQKALIIGYLIGISKKQ